MKMHQFLGIPLRKKYARIPWKTKAKIRHDHAHLIQCGKNPSNVADWVAAKYEIPVSTLYRIIR